MTGDRNIWKLDQDLTVLIQYNATGNLWYRGLFYNSTNGWLYVAPNNNFTVIHVFDLNLTVKYFQY